MPRFYYGKKKGNHHEMAQSERNFHTKTGVLRFFVLYAFLRLLSIFAFVVPFAFETMV